MFKKIVCTLLHRLYHKTWGIYQPRDGAGYRVKLCDKCGRAWKAWRR